MRIYSLAVAPFQIAMSHVTGLLHLMPLQVGGVCPYARTGLSVSRRSCAEVLCGFSFKLPQTRPMSPVVSVDVKYL